MSAQASLPGQTLGASVRTRLSIMMFLQYAIQGIWIIPLGAYLFKVGFSGVAVSWAYNSMALGGLIAPFFVGMIADRFFSAQKVLAVLNIVAGVVLLAASQMATNAAGQPQPKIFFLLLLVHNVCYMPTWALTNSIAMAQMTRPDKQFPGIRVMGTLGWIVVSAVGLLAALGQLEGFKDIAFLHGLAKENIETTTLPMKIGAFIAIAAGLFAVCLPKTPPKSTGEKVTFADILGTKALKLLKEPCFAVFVLCSFIITFALAFYFSFCNAYLNECAWSYTQFKMSIGQMSEVVFMLAMPLFFRRLGVKKMLMVGMLAWVVRFGLFALGNTGPLVAMFYVAVALHGICYDFFFVTGQIYTDKKAPKEIQASAQGFISLVTIGLGMFIGNLLAGPLVDGYVINGQAVTAKASVAIAAPAVIGNAETPSKTWGFNGSIKDVRIYDRALSEQEVVKLQKDPNAADLQQGLAARSPAGAVMPCDANSKHVLNTTLKPGEKITVSAWVNPSAFKTVDQGRYLLYDGRWSEAPTAGSDIVSLGKPGDGYSLSMVGGRLRMDVGSATFEMTQPLQKDTWQQVTGTYDGSTIRLYLNGNAYVRHNWKVIFLVPACIAGAIFIFFGLAFRDKKHDKAEDDEAEPAPAPPAEKNQPTVPEGDIGG